jgi:AmiR/NasT family two-component response regulator
VLLGYARQVESLGEAVDARQDVGTAVGIVMERHGLDRERAFAFIAKLSNDRNVKVRVLAQQIVDGTLPTSMAEEHASQK